MPIHVIVEGKNDRSKLKRLVGPEINILCTFGTLNSLKLETLRKQVGYDEVFLFMDNDSSGKKLEVYFGMLSRMQYRCIHDEDMRVWKEHLMSISLPSWKRPG